jgi:hypothetical protein
MFEQDNITFATESNGEAPFLAIVIAWICKFCKYIDDHLWILVVRVPPENLGQ